MLSLKMRVKVGMPVIAGRPMAGLSLRFHLSLCAASSRCSMLAMRPPL